MTEALNNFLCETLEKLDELYDDMVGTTDKDDIECINKKIKIRENIINKLLHNGTINN